jgi:carboxymethylenebutenolidase
MRAALAELERRLPDEKLGAVGFCFGGGMVWRLIASGDPLLTAAAPFYGPAPKNPDFSGSNAAVLGIYAALDSRINNGSPDIASREEVRTALEEADLTNEILTFEGADHAFFNDTGPRYNAEAARDAYTRVLDWFITYLA